jgi:hypothetical protein
MNKKIISTLAYLAAAVFLAIAVVYFTKSAENLPSFFPGHASGVTTVHFKHGIGALVLAFGALAVGWFASGPKPQGTSPQE